MKLPILLENYFSITFDDPATIIYEKCCFEEFNSAKTAKKNTLFFGFLSNYIIHKGNDCTINELLDAIELVRQRGKWPTVWPCTDEEIKQMLKKIKQQREDDKSPATEPTE